MWSVSSLRAWMIAAGVAGLASTGWPISLARAQTAAAEYFVYFGTYTQGASKGIYAYRFQPAAGKLTTLGLAAETPNPSFLALHPSGRFLFAANEHEAGDGPGKNNSVSAFAVDPTTGALSFLNNVSSRGEGPCHLSIDRTGNTLLVANYGSGSVAALPILLDGRLGEATGFDQHQGTSADPVRQTGPHAHFIAPSPDNRFVLTADLGLDQVIVYRFDPAKGTLSRNSPPFATIRAGSGPRHLAFHPSGKYVYVNSEMASTVSAFAWDASRGSLEELQTISTLPSGFARVSSTAEIHIDRAGRFLYVSNRGHDSIAIFSIDQATGELTLVGHAATNGQTPRYFTLDPTGNFLFAANQNSSSVVVFRVEPKTGRITPAQTISDIPEPVCMVFVPVSTQVRPAR
jgi:6-phosphogluconolactonase